MVVDDAPCLTTLFVDVRGQNTATPGAINRINEIFNAGDPGHVTVKVDRNIGEHKVHIIRIGKDCRPALAHCFPALEQIPPGMDALGPVRLHPCSRHLFDVQTLKSAVKLFICTPNLRQNFVLGWHSDFLVSSGRKNRKQSLSSGAALPQEGHGGKTSIATNAVR